METTKLEAAEAQLVTAIKLFFQDEDDVAIHTLTRASHEILDTLCAKKNLTRGVIYQGLENIRPELHKKIIDKVNEAKNYFKHADRDTEETLSWNPKLSEYFIWDSTSLHRQLVGVKQIPEITIYSLWFRLHHDDMWVEANGEASSLDVLLPNSKNEFADLSKKKFFEISMVAWNKGSFR
jgi:hypothetical protein